MPPRPEGQIIERRRATGTVYALRFRAYRRREYLTLGSSSDGWTRQRAEIELQNILADVRRGLWKPPLPNPALLPPEDPTFHRFASDWFEAHRREWRPNTIVDYLWQLSHHLLPFFHAHRLGQITIAEVDRYRNEKVREGMISPTSINKTITRLAQILEEAVEYGMIPSNPAKGRRRRLRTTQPAPVWLDGPAQIQALLDGAGDVDREFEPLGIAPYRRAMIATLTFAGLRVGELCELRWRDVDLSGGRILVRQSKTDAGRRSIDLLPALRDELASHKARVKPADPDEYVFVTSKGRCHNPSNIRKRVVDRAVEHANERLKRAGEVPLPEGISPHKLRHTYASVLVCLGVDPGAVMDQLGHASANFTLRVYRHSMRRSPQAKRDLSRIVGAPDWAPMGTSTLFDPSATLASPQRTTPKLADYQPRSTKPETGLEPVTLRLQGEASIDSPQRVLPAYRLVMGRRRETEFGLISADFGGIKDNGGARCPFQGAPAGPISGRLPRGMPLSPRKSAGRPLTAGTIVVVLRSVRGWSRLRGLGALRFRHCQGRPSGLAFGDR